MTLRPNLTDFYFWLVVTNYSTERIPTWGPIFSNTHNILDNPSSLCLQFHNNAMKQCYLVSDMLPLVGQNIYMNDAHCVANSWTKKLMKDLRKSINKRCKRTPSANNSAVRTIKFLSYKCDLLNICMYTYVYVCRYVTNICMYYIFDINEKFPRTARLATRYAISALAR